MNNIHLTYIPIRTYKSKTDNNSTEIPNWFGIIIFIFIIGIIILLKKLSK